MVALIILLFGLVMAGISWLLRRRDRDGYWDRDWSDRASRPGMRWFFDFRGSGNYQGHDNRRDRTAG